MKKLVNLLILSIALNAILLVVSLDLGIRVTNAQEQFEIGKEVGYKEAYFSLPEVVLKSTNLSVEEQDEALELFYLD